MQLSAASLSAMPRRLPKNVIRFGTPICLAFGSTPSNVFTMVSCSCRLFRLSGIEPPPWPGNPVEQMSPCLAATSHSSGCRRSIGREAHGRDAAAELLEGNFRVAPAADRLSQAAALHGFLLRLSARARVAQRRAHGRSPCGGERLTSCHSSHKDLPQLSDRFQPQMRQRFRRASVPVRVGHVAHVLQVLDRPSSTTRIPKR